MHNKHEMDGTLESIYAKAAYSTHIAYNIIINTVENICAMQSECVCFVAGAICYDYFLLVFL